MGASVAQADQVTVDADSAAHGHGIWLEGLGLDVAGAANSLSEYPDNAGPNSDPLNLELLGGLTVDLGSIQLPLLGDENNEGLLNLGDLGAISSRSASTSATSSVASSGAITSDGSIDLGAVNDPESFERGQIDLSGLLRQVLSEDVVNNVLDEASLSVGAVASTASETEGVVDSEYMFSGLGLDVHSPLAGNLVGDVDSALGTILQPIQDLLGPGGGIESLVSGVVGTIDAIPLVNAELNALSIDTTPLTDEVRSVLLQTPLENAEGSVSIDLSQGLIHVDLDELVVDSEGATSLSTLDPNTEVLSAGVVNSIVDGVTDAIIGAGENSLVTKVVDVVTNGIYNLEFNLDIQVSALGLVNAPVTVTSTVGGLLGIDGHDDPVIDTSQIDVAGIPVGTVLQPIVNALTGLLANIGGVLQPVIDSVLPTLQENLTAALQPIVDRVLGEGLEPLLSQVVSLRINEQPTVAPLNGEGDFGADSFTVRALSVTLLPVLGDAAAKLELASSTVKALDEAPAEATLTATPNPVNQGDDVTLTGGGYEPGETVTITLPDGTTTEVTAEDDGSFTTVWTVPEDYTPGDAEFTAVGNDSGLSATAVTVVQDANAEVDADANTAADANVNASASASASADAAADNDATASAQAAAQAAADEDANSTASAAADTTANAAAEAAANEDASTTASAESNAAASAASQASADSTADSAQDADASAAASAAADADSRAAASAASEAAAESNSSADASAAASANINAAADANANPDADANANPDADATANANVNASASASASADAAADDDATASAQAAAQAAADEDANSTASAAADTTANSAASVAANADASTAASAESNAAASAASQASADSTADSAQDADASAEASAAANADARAAAAASAEAAAESDASTDASSAASANINADADSSAAAEAAADNDSSASASASADNDATASAAASADSNGKDGNLSNTGSNLTMLGVAAALLLLLGAGAVALQRYRARLTQ